MVSFVAGPQPGELHKNLWITLETWQAFIQHRAAKRKPLTPQAVRLPLRDLDKARRFGHDPVALIEAAIAAGWTGCVFEDRHFHPAAAPPHHGQPRPPTAEHSEWDAILDHLNRPALEEKSFMNAIDKPAFAALIVKTWGRFYGKRPEAEDIAAWFDLLEDCPFAAVAMAFKRHLTDVNTGQYLPKPADIIRHLSTTRREMTAIPIPTKPGACWCG